MERLTDPQVWIVIAILVLIWVVADGVRKIVAALDRVRDQVLSVEKTMVYCLSEEDREDGRVLERIRDALYTVGRKVAPDAGF